MTTWIKERFDSVEHTKVTISAGAVIASAMSVLLMIAWLFLTH